MSSPIVPRSVPIASRLESGSPLLMSASSPRSPQRSAGDMSTCWAGVCGTTDTRVSQGSRTGDVSHHLQRFHSQRMASAAQVLVAGRRRLVVVRLGGSVQMLSLLLLWLLPGCL